MALTLRTETAEARVVSINKLQNNIETTQSIIGTPLKVRRKIPGRATKTSDGLSLGRIFIEKVVGKTTNFVNMVTIALTAITRAVDPKRPARWPKQEVQA